MGAKPQATDTAAYQQFTEDLHDGMARMMHDMHAAAPSGNPDVDFLTMMIPHHEGAVDMARLVLREGRDPFVRSIAEKIVSGQVSEIEGMRGRLVALNEGSEEFPALDGNRGP